MFSLQRFREDIKNKNFDEDRTAKIFLEILNSLERDLKFTIEVAENFSTNTLPTLSSSCGWARMISPEVRTYQ